MNGVTTKAQAESVRIEGLTKRFTDGTVGLDGVGLAAPSGELVAVLGPNGSGKSTLLRCINGLERASSGSIKVDGIEVVGACSAQLRRLRRRVGMVFQQYRLIGPLSVLHNVLHGALGYSRGPHYWWPATAPARLRELACEHLDRVGMLEYITRRADTLSGGQQQRVAIARMLMQDPVLVLGDEVVSSLDPGAAEDVMGLLREIADEGRTVICVLHHVELALRYGDRIVALNRGRVALDQPAGAMAASELDELYPAARAVRPMVLSQTSARPAV